MKKSLNLPSEIRDSIYTVKIAFNTSGYARNVTAHLKGQPWVSADSWLLPGLKVDQLESEVVESSEKTVIAGCSRVSADVYVWIKEL
jgi:hypothetical protein